MSDEKSKKVNIQQLVAQLRDKGQLPQTSQIQIAKEQGVIKAPPPMATPGSDTSSNQRGRILHKSSQSLTR